LEFSTAYSGHYSTFIRVLRGRVLSAPIFGLFFHLKTCGLAEKSKFEDFGTVFEKQNDSARSGLEAGVQKYFLTLFLLPYFSVFTFTFFFFSYLNNQKHAKAIQ
jgi:hypothetical protein